MIEFLKNNIVKATFEVDIKTIPIDTSRVSQQQTQNEPGKEPKPDEENYYTRKFRLLSATIVRAGCCGYPIDYSQDGVLKKALNLFSERTMYTDHLISVSNWCGLVKNASYNTETTPPGVDADLCVDRRLKRNDDIILGLETGAITRCSVTITFQWKQSHPKMKDDDFFALLGEEVDGQLVRLIVEKIIQIYETSLVWWGADDTAKSHQKEEHIKNQNNKHSVATPQQEVQKLDKEKLKQVLSQALGRAITTDVEMQQAIEELGAQFTALQQDKSGLLTQVEALKKHESFVTEIKQTLHDQVMSLAKLTNGGKEPDALTKLNIDNANYEQLLTIKESLEAKKVEMFPFVCQNCGNPVKEIRSSLEIPPEKLQQAQQTPVNGGKKDDVKEINDI